MGLTLLSVLLLPMLNTLLHYGHAQDAMLMTDPSWSPFFIGESITFICDMMEGEDSDWKYKINKDGQAFVVSNTQERYTLGPLTKDHSGEYQCVGFRKNSQYTKNSNTVSLTISDAPKATLTRGTTTISLGASVTLTCSIQSYDIWKYQFLRVTQKNSDAVLNPVEANDEENNVASVSQGGVYQCRGGRGIPVFYTSLSDEVTIRIIFSNEAVLTSGWSQVFSGETVTLTCKIVGGENTEWVYEWSGTKSYIHWTYNNYYFFSVSESSNRAYKCRGRRREDLYSLTEWSKAVSLSILRKPKALLIADIRDVPIGGSVSLSCSVDQSSGWEYFWYRDDKSSEPLSQKDAAFHSNGQISVSQGGLYRCRGGRGDLVYYTEYSEPVEIRKKEPKSVLTLSPSWLIPGSSVILNCAVQHPSAEWKFFWYKAVPKVSDNYNYSYELLPGTEQDSYSIPGQTHTAGYACRAGIGDPVYYSSYSEPKFVWSGDLHAAVSLTVNPDNVQHFHTDSVSLSCGKNLSEWRLSRFSEDGSLEHCGTMTGSACNAHRIRNGNAVYWCESGSTFSSAVNITGQDYDDGIILVSPVHPVTEGDSVVLGCESRMESVLSDVLFYKNDKLIQSDARGELSIPTVSKTDEGFYKCQHSGKESPQSWMAVKCCAPEISSLNIALVCVILLIVILLALLVYYFRKDLHCGRLNQPLNVNRGSAVHQTESQNETQVYSSLLHGDASVYESIRGSGKTESDNPDLNDYSNVTPLHQTEGKVRDRQEMGVKSRGRPAARGREWESNPGRCIGNEAPVNGP